MRITIETTDEEPEFSRKGIVEVPRNDIDIEELFEMFIGCAEAAGFVGVRDAVKGE